MGFVDGEKKPFNYMINDKVYFGTCVSFKKPTVNFSKKSSSVRRGRLIVQFHVIEVLGFDRFRAERGTINVGRRGFFAQSLTSLMFDP